MGLNATARTFNVSKKSVIDWERRLAKLKPTLMLYALLQEFIHQEVEGDELYRARSSEAATRGKSMKFSQGNVFGGQSLKWL